MKIKKTIFFDLFNVMIGVDQSVMVNYVAKLTDTPYILTKEIVQGEIFMRYERGEIDFRQYFSDIQYALTSGERLEYDEFKKCIIDNFLHTCARVISYSYGTETWR